MNKELIMKDLLNKRYLTYFGLIILVLAIPLIFGASQLFILAMMLPPLLGWLMVLERKRHATLRTLQDQLNNLSTLELRRLALLCNVSVKSLRTLSTAHLTHQQITQLKQALFTKE